MTGCNDVSMSLCQYVRTKVAACCQLCSFYNKISKNDNKSDKISINCSKVMQI